MCLLWPEPFSEGTWSRAVFAIAGPLLIVIRHWPNLVRLARGEEKKFRAKSETPAAGAEAAERLEGQR
jgi:hypothetical protein